MEHGLFATLLIEILLLRRKNWKVAKQTGSRGKSFSTIQLFPSHVQRDE